MANLVLLCEGEQDRSFFRKLIEARNLPSYEVITPRLDQDPGGVRGFASRLRALRVESCFADVKGLLVMVDNDLDPRAAFALARRQMVEAGYPAPEGPFQLAGDDAGVSVMVGALPGESESGRLETLCIEAFSSLHPEIAECVRQLCACAGTASWPQHKLEKMQMRAMLATCCKDDPNTSLAHAWSRKAEMIPLQHRCFDRVADLLARFPTLLAG